MNIDPVVEEPLWLLSVNTVGVVQLAASERLSSMINRVVEMLTQ